MLPVCVASWLASHHNSHLQTSAVSSIRDLPHSTTTTERFHPKMCPHAPNCTDYLPAQPQCPKHSLNVPNKHSLNVPNTAYQPTKASQSALWRPPVRSLVAAHSGTVAHTRPWRFQPLHVSASSEYTQLMCQIVMYWVNSCQAWHITQLFKTVITSVHSVVKTCGTVWQDQVKVWRMSTKYAVSSCVYQTLDLLSELVLPCE